MFRDYFFNKQSEQSFRLFKIIKSFNAANFTVNKLSRIVGMGYAQTYKAFRSVLNDLMTLTGMHPASDKEPEFAIMAADVDVEQYQAFLLTKSTSFQYFSTLFIHDGIDSTAFCAQHGITIRTLRRLITPFRKYLQTYNIDIDPVDGTMAGDELRILFMLHEFFSQGYRGGAWPFTHPSADETMAMYTAINSDTPGAGLPAHTVPTRRALIDIAVVALRIRQGHVNRINPRLISIFSRREPLPTMNITTQFFPGLSEDEVRRARLTVYFFWINLPTLSTDNRAINHEFCQYLDSFSNPVASMVHRLRQCIADLLNARDQNIFLANQVVATNMFKVMLNYYVLGRTFVKAADFGDTQEQMQHYQPLMTAIHQCITTIPKDAPEHIFTRLVDDIELALFTTLTPVLPLFKTIEPLNIRLELEGESFLNKDIVGFLNSFAVINVLPQDSSVAPDVILCSIDNYDKVYNLLHPGAGKLDPEPTIIHWSNQSEDTTLLNLLGRINELANAKAARLAHRTDE